MAANFFFFVVLLAEFQIWLRWDLKMENICTDIEEIHRICFENREDIDWLLHNWEWHDREEDMFHPSEAKVHPELLFSDTSCENQRPCENGMKSSIILLLKNVWLSISYIRLTACVSVLLVTCDSVIRGKCRGQRVNYEMSKDGRLY